MFGCVATLDADTAALAVLGRPIASDVESIGGEVTRTPCGRDPEGKFLGSQQRQ
jgi:hypothetical protein